MTPLDPIALTDERFVRLSAALDFPTNTRMSDGPRTEVRCADLCWLMEHAANFASLEQRGLKVMPREITDEMEDAADPVFHAEWKEQREASQRDYSKDAFASGGFSGKMWRAPCSTPSPPNQFRKTRHETDRRSSGANRHLHRGALASRCDGVGGDP